MSGKKGFQRRQWIWIMLMVDIVFMLLLMTLGIIALQVSGGPSDNTDIIFIAGKNYDFDITDDNGKTWDSNTDVQIFQASYVNDQGVATVKSSNGNAVFAPGSTATYSFAMYNDGNSAVLYQTNIRFALFVNNSSATESQFESLPMLVSLYTTDETGNRTYFIGNQTSGVPLNQALVDNSQLATLGATSYQKFTMELHWPYESGNDALDTLLGDLAVTAEANGGARINMQISTHAEAHPNSTAQGGIKQDLDNTGGNLEQGGTIRWLWLVLLMINAAVLIFYVAWLLNKRQADMQSAQTDQEDND